MKRAVFEQTLSCVLAIVVAGGALAAERFEHGLLWRVSRGGVAPSHVFGTIHSADPRAAELPAAVQKAFARSRSLTLEYVADGYGRERFLEAAMFLDRQTLQGKIGAEDFGRVLAMFAPLGLRREFVDKLKPWGVLLNVRAADASPQAGVTLDGLLFDMAGKRRMAVEEMEELEEQVSLFDDFPMHSQVALLKHALAHRGELVGMAEATMQAYLRRDLAGIWRVQAEFAARHPEIAPHNEPLVKRVLHDRSVVMAFRMQRQMRRGGAFVALGALHLYGAKGVLALIEKDGWRVARVY